MPPPADVLVLTAGLPERTLAAGEALFAADDPGTAVVVLVDGRLRVSSGATALPGVEVPGSFVGEIAALLGTGRTAQVVADGPVTVRVIGEPAAFFADHPELALELARQLAGRLHRLTAYLADVQAQYAGSDGHLGLVASVLGRLATRAPVDVEPGSERAPDH